MVVWLWLMVNHSINQITTPFTMNRQRHGSRWLRLVDFWEARGPPEWCEAPPAKLQLQAGNVAAGAS